MAISFTCSCGHVYSLQDSLAGQRRKCMYCGAIMDIPSVPAAELPADSFDLQPEQPEQPQAPQPASARPAYYRPQLRPSIPVNATAEDLAARAAAIRASYGAPPLVARPVQIVQRPEWSRRYWLLLLALIPLVISSFKKDDFDYESKLRETVEAMSEPDRVKFIVQDSKLDPATATVHDEVDLLPGHKLKGALLPVHTGVHWLLALLSAVVFLVVIGLFSPSNTTTVGALILVGLFTGTIGILLLLGVQWVALNLNWVPRGSGVIIAIWAILKFIGFSYVMALSSDYGFVLSLLGFTFGVGLCEELCKALPVFHHFVSYGKKMDWRGACAWGLAAGIGFGVSEGITYSSDFYNGTMGGEIYVIRFVSCVALHAIWSATAGLSIWKRRNELNSGGIGNWERFFKLVQVIIIPMLLHGFYDTLLKKEMNLLAMVAALASFAFFAWKIEDAKSVERVMEPHVVTA